MVFFTLLLIPIIVLIGSFIFFNSRISLKEFLIQIVIQIGIAILSSVVIYQSNMMDIEIRNGKILSKTPETVSCSHSYDCFCYESCSGTGSDETCTRICQTCYEHSFDKDWNVTSTLGKFSINREDSQGLIEPRRWKEVEIGESYSEEFFYENPIKGSPDTLFRNQGLLDKYKTLIPKYPSVYDYYRIKRAIFIGVNFLDKSDWNLRLDNINKELGPEKKANLNVVIVANQPREYFYALQQAWIGGKKNDITTVIGIKDNSIIWAEVMLWSDHKLTAIKIRDELQELGIVDSEKVLKIIEKNVSETYKRKSMKDFDYLKASITPTVSQWIIAILFGLFVSIFTSWFFYENEF